MTQNWRIETDAQDYFGHQKKQNILADRRPVNRQAADFVGPGIGISAVRITDFNNLLALCNGYFSSAIGAANAPNAIHPFIGFVIMDDELGGEQVFRSLTSGTQYYRLVLRNPGDPSSLSFGAWI